MDRGPRHDDRTAAVRLGPWSLVLGAWSVLGSWSLVRSEVLGSWSLVRSEVLGSWSLVRSEVLGPWSPAVQSDGPRTWDQGQGRT
ncbi:MAG: hypothetical protein DMF95_28575 [Acidobacteria bacterium]|nr:MAG: hypothetical protein DMF96_04030 [Acidobacteriota bacterium]PYR42352.1 MAG: hypothetical protein DMF95_28575 [Acidobacteriota bacterium]